MSYGETKEMDIRIILLIVFILAVVIPIGISYIIYKWIKNKGFNKRFRLLALIPILIVSYSIYTAIYPSAEFYKTDFKEVTNMEFPEDGIIKYKTASFPDQWGDYTSSFLTELSENDISKLEKQLKTNGFEEKQSNMYIDELEYIENKNEGKIYLRQFVLDTIISKYYSIGFLNDNKSVIITRASW